MYNINDVYDFIEHSHLDDEISVFDTDNLGTIFIVSEKSTKVTLKRHFPGINVFVCIEEIAMCDHCGKWFLWDESSWERISSIFVDQYSGNHYCLKCLIKYDIPGMDDINERIENLRQEYIKYHP